MALINRDPRVINDWTKGNKNDVPSMELYRLEKKTREDEDAKLWAALRKEIADRIAGDDALWAALRKEIADRIAADDAERAARIAADDAERAARIAEDNAIWAALRQEIADRISGDDAIWAALRQEIADRISGDTTLQTNINSEANARSAEDNRIWAAINGLSGDITNIINTPAPTIRVSDVIGDWPVTRIDGKLDPNNIDIDKLKNTLEDWVKSLAECNCSSSSSGGSGGAISIGGSLDNGYIQFGDLLICYGTATLKAISGSYGGTTTVTQTFAKAFSQKPFNIACGQTSYHAGNDITSELVINHGGATTTDITFAGSISTVAGSRGDIVWLAIGQAA